MRRIPLVFAFLAVGLAAVGAQLNPGDLVITYIDTGVSPNLTNTVKLDPGTGAVTTLVSSNVSLSALGNWVQMAPDNQEVWVAYQGTGAAMYKIDSGGNLVTTVPLTWRTDGFRIADDNRITWSVIGGSPSKTNVLFSTDLNFQNPTTIVTGLRGTSLNHAKTEGERYVTSSQTTSPNGAVQEIDAQNGVIIQTIGGMGLCNTVDYHKAKGKVYATEFAVPGNTSAQRGSLYEVDLSAGTFTSLIDGMTAGGAFVDRLNWLEYQRDGTLLLGARHKIFKYDLTRGPGTIAIVKTWTFQTDRTKAVTGATVYGSRPLRLDTSGGRGPGATVPIRLSFAQRNTQGAFYALAVSQAHRPGIIIAGQVLDLDFTSPLFTVSALNRAPTIFADFQGQLDAFGKPRTPLNPRIIIPAIPALVGQSIYVGALAIISSQIVVTNAESFTIRT